MCAQHPATPMWGSLRTQPANMQSSPPPHATHIPAAKPSLEGHVSSGSKRPQIWVGISQVAAALQNPCQHSSPAQNAHLVPQGCPKQGSTDPLAELARSEPDAPPLAPAPPAAPVVPLALLSVFDAPPCPLVDALCPLG